MKIALVGLYYPFAMLSYFRRALERRNDVELVTVGAFTGQHIPWNGGMEIPNKYLNQVDIPLPANSTSISWNILKPLLPWAPDLVLNIDAGFHLTSKPDVPYYVVGTDPHVLSPWYEKVRPIADVFFNMQHHPYLRDGDVWLPYAFDPYAHYPIQRFYSDGGAQLDAIAVREYDCSIIGLHYPQRDDGYTDDAIFATGISNRVRKEKKTRKPIMAR